MIRQSHAELAIRASAPGHHDFTAKKRNRVAQDPDQAAAALLGAWQGIYLFEHRRDPPQRRIALHLIGE